MGNSAEQYQLRLLLTHQRIAKALKMAKRSNHHAQSLIFIMIPEIVHLLRRA